VFFDGVITLNLTPCQKYGTAFRGLNSPNAETWPFQETLIGHSGEACVIFLSCT